MTTCVNFICAVYSLQYTMYHSAGLILAGLSAFTLAGLQDCYTIYIIRFYVECLLGDG